MMETEPSSEHGVHDCGGGLTGQLSLSSSAVSDEESCFTTTTNATITTYKQTDTSITQYHHQGNTQCVVDTQKNCCGAAVVDTSGPDIEADLQRQLAALTSEYYINETGDRVNNRGNVTQDSCVPGPGGAEKAQRDPESEETGTNAKLGGPVFSNVETPLGFVTRQDVVNKHRSNLRSTSRCCNPVRRRVKDRHILEEFGLITSQPKRGRPRKYPPGSKKPKHLAYKLHLNKISLDRFRDMKERIGNQFKTDRTLLMYMMDKEDERMNNIANRVVEGEAELVTCRHMAECRDRQPNRRICDCLKLSTSLLSTGEVSISVGIEQLRQMIDLRRAGSYRDTDQLIDHLLKLELNYQTTALSTDEKPENMKSGKLNLGEDADEFPPLVMNPRDKALELLTSLKQNTQYLVCESQRVLRITNQNNLGLDMAGQPLLVPTDAFIALLMGKAGDKNTPTSCMSVVPSPVKKRPMSDVTPSSKSGRGRGQSRSQRPHGGHQKENMSGVMKRRQTNTPGGGVTGYLKERPGDVDWSENGGGPVSVTVPQRDECSQCNLIDVDRLLHTLNAANQPTNDDVILTDLSALDRNTISELSSRENSSLADDEDGSGVTSDSGESPVKNSKEDPVFNINKFLGERSSDEDEGDGEPFRFDMMDDASDYESTVRRSVTFQKPLLDHDNLNCLTCPVLPERQRPKCPVCDELFKSKKTLKKHATAHHPGHKLENFLCHICGRDFHARSSIRNHILGHSDVRSEMCEVCGVLFRRPVQLLKHVQTVHAKIRPHHCSQEGCTKEFSTKNGLRKHQLTHTDVKNVSCPWAGCGRLFRRHVHLKVHMLLHTNQFPLNCQLCDYKCRQRNALNWHMKSKHGEEPSGVMSTDHSMTRRKRQRPPSHDYRLEEGGLDEIDKVTVAAPLDVLSFPSQSQSDLSVVDHPITDTHTTPNTKPLLCTETIPAPGGFDSPCIPAQQEPQQQQQLNHQQQQQQTSNNHAQHQQRSDMLLPGSAQDSVHSSWFLTNQRENDHFGPGSVISNTDPGHYATHGPPVLNPDWQWNWAQSSHDFPGYLPRFNYYHSN